MVAALFAPFLASNKGLASPCKASCCFPRTWNKASLATNHDCFCSWFLDLLFFDEHLFKGASREWGYSPLVAREALKPKKNNANPPPYAPPVESGLESKNNSCHILAICHDFWVSNRWIWSVLQGDSDYNKQNGQNSPNRPRSSKSPPSLDHFQR